MADRLGRKFILGPEANASAFVSRYVGGVSPALNLRTKRTDRSDRFFQATWDHSLRLSVLTHIRRSFLRSSIRMDQEDGRSLSGLAAVSVVSKTELNGSGNRLSANG